MQGDRLQSVVIHEDLIILLQAVGYGFGICGFVALVQPASARAITILWSIGGIGFGGLMAALGTRNAGWMIVAVPAGAWMGYICGTIVRSWFQGKDD